MLGPELRGENSSRRQGNLHKNEIVCRVSESPHVEPARLPDELHLNAIEARRLVGCSGVLGGIYRTGSIPRLECHISNTSMRD